MLGRLVSHILLSQYVSKFLCGFSKLSREIQTKLMYSCDVKKRSQFSHGKTIINFCFNPNALMVQSHSTDGTTASGQDGIESLWATLARSTCK